MIIMILVSYYDPKLYHMNVKIIFLNKDLDKKIYIYNTKDSQIRERKAELTNLENPFIISNEFLNNDI